jgi:hypothetical protein
MVARQDVEVRTRQLGEFMSFLKIVREGMWVVVGFVVLGFCFECDFEWYYFVAAVC